MKTLKVMTSAAICLISFAASVAAQSSAVTDAVTDLMAKYAMPSSVVIYSTEFDVSTSGENSGLSGKSIFKNSLIMTSKTFRSKLAKFVKNGEVTNVNNHFLTVVDGTAGEISGGRQIPVIKSDAADFENAIELINAGYLLKAAPVVVHTATNPIPDAVSLRLEIADNEVFEDGIPTVIRREIKADESFNPGNTRIFGGFLSKDGLTRRYFAVSVRIGK